MPFCFAIKMYISRVKRACGPRKAAKTQKLEISAPFNFQKQDSFIPGISDDEMSVLREKAIASRLGTMSQVQVVYRRPSIPTGSGPMSLHPVVRTTSVDKDTAISEVMV